MPLTEPAWTVVLSGPETKRAAAEVALEDAGFFPLPDDHHALFDWPARFPDEKKGTGWVTVQAEDVDAVVAAIEKHKWRLRVHYPTPTPPEPSAEQKLAATVDEMRAELDNLKQKVGA